MNGYLQGVQHVTYCPYKGCDGLR